MDFKKNCAFYIYSVTFLSVTPTSRSCDKKYEMDGSILWLKMGCPNAHFFTDKVTFLNSKSKVLL